MKFHFNFREIVSIVNILKTHWNLETPYVNIVSNSAHSVWCFESCGEIFYTRFSKPESYGETIWSSAAAFLRHAFESSVPVCEIVFSNSSKLVETLEVNNQIRLVQVLRKVPGRELTPKLLENPLVLKAWGELLGQLHACTQTLDQNLKFPSCADLWEDAKNRLPPDDEKIKLEYNEITRWLNSMDHSFNFGINHGDFRPGNGLWDGQRVHLIDFDEPVWHWFIYDISNAMLDFTDELVNRREKLELFMSGYRLHHEVEFSPHDFYMMSRCRVLLMYLWASKDSGFSVNDLNDLRRKIQNPTSW
jgi:Ser/Thr protein kinase RdoA (MazF antagonist)